MASKDISLKKPGTGIPAKLMENFIGRKLAKSCYEGEQIKEGDFLDEDKKIYVLLVDRTNYGRMYPVMKVLDKDPDLELQVICAGTMLLERFGKLKKWSKRMI